METRRKHSRCGAGRAYPAPQRAVPRTQMSTSGQQGFSVTTEQLLIFSLAIWFFYFFYLQD